MEIKTKYNIGDEMWTMHDNKVICFTIKGINIKVEDKTLVEYISSEKFKQHSYFSDRLEYMPLYIKEEKVFLTREELLKSL